MDCMRSINWGSLCAEFPENRDIPCNHRLTNIRTNGDPRESAVGLTEVRVRMGEMSEMGGSVEKRNLTMGHNYSVQ